MLRLGWMSTARGPGSLALLQFVCDRIEAGALDARISVVISNREPGESPQTDRYFEFVRSQGLPLVCESSSRLRQTAPGDDWRTRFDSLLARRIEAYDIDVIFLAGYMLIVSDVLCTRYPLLNLHPALPGGPTGTWNEVMGELARTGARRTGAMVHVVTPVLDRGPTVSFFSFPLEGEPFDSARESGDVTVLAAVIRAEELKREFPLILTTLQALAGGRIVIKALRAYDGEGNPLQSGMDLSAQVEESLARG
ncbi:MAG: phosphoglycerate transporter [Dehalococcoidia bacterium]|jgi:folate-dependent phosphoribosylglycinamide formyltransferase PurN|nr:phosphoglycerate transporter [Dehalococcoidia bacterium]